MKKMRFALATVLWIGLFEATRATTYYVATNGAGGDFLSWGTAASSIQDAISKATTANDIVLVSNGVYETGGVTNWPSGTLLTNRVAITNAITVMSANTNPANTIIKGRFDTGEPGASGTVTNGPAAVRCVYMVNSTSAKLIGFTLTNGATLTSGSGANVGGGVYVTASSSASIMSNCVMAGNAAVSAGGAYCGTLYNCTLRGNFAIPNGNGGAVQSSILYNCLLIGNMSGNAGGAAYYSTLYNCMIISNTTTGYGGGTGYQNSYNCKYIGNTGTYGGAAYGGSGDGIMSNCLLIGNSATYGGGVYGISGNGYILYSCTVANNSATYGGGVSLAQMYNCIVYFNRATTSGSNWYSTCGFTNSCTSSNPAVWAANNITDNPMLVDTNAPNYNYRLAANSPCIDKGMNQNWMTNGIDLDGRTRIRYGVVDMGAYERIHDGTVYGFR